MQWIIGSQKQKSNKIFIGWSTVAGASRKVIGHQWALTIHMGCKISIRTPKMKSFEVVPHQQSQNQGP